MRDVIYVGYEADNSRRQNGRPTKLLRSRREADQWRREPSGTYWSPTSRWFERVELGKMHEECERVPEMASLCDNCRPIVERFAPFKHLLKQRPRRIELFSIATTTPIYKMRVKCPACAMRCPQGLSPKTWWPEHWAQHEAEAVPTE